MKGALKDLQGWMQHELVRPYEKLPRAARASDWVRPSATLTPEERVELYSGMYRLRMIEALEVDYPAVLRFLGHERFSTLMLAYLAKHPSRHYSLNFLGYALPEFLDGQAKVQSRAFLADVARVENAITIVFDEPESPRLDPSALATIPPDVWAEARIELIAPLRLLALSHQANKAVTELRHDKDVSDTRRTPSWVVVYRKEWNVWRMDLEHAAFVVLGALAAKKPLPTAIAAGARVFDGTPDELQTKIQGWFSEWVAEGLFSAIHA